MTAEALPSTPPPLAFLRTYPREAMGGGLLAVAAVVGLVGLANPAASLPRLLTPTGQSAAPNAPPPVEPMLVKDIAPGTAEALNASVPVVGGPNPAALPFHPARLKGETYDRALECLTEAIYYEAATEALEGQQAVAQVVLNRVRHPAYPASVCGVVYQGHERRTGCQFTFTCDGALARAPQRAFWDRSRNVARAALAGYVYAPVGTATHYHTDWVVPYWASSLVKSAVIGSHIFYRWAGGWGRPAAFVQRYAGNEPDARALKVDSLRAEAVDRALAAAEPATPADSVAKAKQQLPPELARLVDAEIGPAGDTRIALRIDTPRGNAGSKPSLEQLDRAMGSDNLRWSLTGGDVPASEQKPLGKAPAASPKVVAQGVPADTASGAD